MCLGELSWVKFSVRHFILHELRSTYWPKRYKAKLVLRLKLLGGKVKYNSLLTIDLLSKKGIKLIKRIEFVTRRMTTLYTYLKCAFAMALLFCFLGIHIAKWRANSPLSLLSILKNSGIHIVFEFYWYFQNRWCFHGSNVSFVQSTRHAGGQIRWYILPQIRYSILKIFCCKHKISYASISKKKIDIF